MTFRERINQVADSVDESLRLNLAIKTFAAYCRKTKVKFDQDDDLLKEGGAFMTFLESECDESIVEEGLGNVKEFNENYIRGTELIRKGEEMIRDGYRLRENGDVIHYKDTISGYPRIHGVSLLGIDNSK